MDIHELQKILEQLKQELAASEFVKSTSKSDLQQLIDQIEGVISEDEKMTADLLNEPLNDAVTRFEGSHPQLTAILNNIISALSNMGI